MSASRWLSVVLASSVAVPAFASPKSIVCNPKDLKSIQFKGGEPKSDPDLDRRLQAALTSIVQTVPIRNFNKTGTDDLVQLLGTGFAVQTEGKISWLSAAHVLQGLKGNSRVLLFPSKNSYVDWDESGDGRFSREKLTKGSSQLSLGDYHEDKLLPYQSANQPGFDFGQFYIPLTVEPLELRNVESEPVQWDEPLYIVGLQLGFYRNYLCRYRGISSESFEGGQLLARLKCKDIPTDEEGNYQLGGISGGPVVDRSGAVVGIFVGAEERQRKNGEIFIQMQPIYFGSRSGMHRIQPFPLISKSNEAPRCLPCYPYPKKGSPERQVCVLVKSQVSKDQFSLDFIIGR